MSSWRALVWLGSLQLVWCRRRAQQCKSLLPYGQPQTARAKQWSYVATDLRLLAWTTATNTRQGMDVIPLCYGGWLLGSTRICPRAALTLFSSFGREVPACLAGLLKGNKMRLEVPQGRAGWAGAGRLGAGRGGVGRTGCGRAGTFSGTRTGSRRGVVSRRCMRYVMDRPPQNGCGDKQD